MIWKKQMTLPQLQAQSEGCMNTFLGIEFTEIGADYLMAKMPVDQRTCQPMGLLHGGASAALSETLGSVAGNLCLDQPNQAAVGLEINANHLRGVKIGEWVYGKTTPVKIGRTIQVWNTEIFNEEGKMVCTSRLTLAVINLS